MAVRKDRSRFWASAVRNAIRDSNGKLVGFVKITKDMTERRRARQALAESERRFRLLVTSVIDYALFSLDLEGIVQSWNPGAERVKSYTAEEIIGKHFSIVYTPEAREAGEPERVLSTARNEGRFEAEGWRVRKGRKPVLGQCGDRPDPRRSRHLDRLYENHPRHQRASRVGAGAGPALAGPEDGKRRPADRPGSARF